MAQMAKLKPGVPPWRMLFATMQDNVNMFHFRLSEKHMVRLNNELEVVAGEAARLFVGEPILCDFE